MTAPGSLRTGGFGPHQSLLAAGAGSLLLAGWLAYLAANVPAVSRGDFFLAMMRVARSVERGDLLYAITWPVHILGGHIVFYERVLQLVNYYLFGFSPQFVKGAALAAWSLLAFGAFLFVRRLPLSEGARFACMLLLALLTFSPLPWATVVWADSTIPYLSALIALLFVAPALVRGIESGWRAAGRGRMLLCCVAVIFGSGVGWAILPALAWLAALRKVRRGQGRKVLVVTATAVVVVSALVWLLVTFFWLELRLRDVAVSLATLPANVGRVGAYFLSLLGTFSGVSERPWNLPLGAAFFVASLATCFFYRRREGRATEPELLYLFGMLGLVLVTLGRWKVAVDIFGGSPPSYYHLFALPAYYGFIAMALRLLPQRSAPWVGLAALAALGASYAVQTPAYHRELAEQRDLYLNMIRPLQGWRMTESTRMIGGPEINHEVYFDFLPMLKRTGRYSALSGPFEPYKSTRIAPPVPTGNGNSCSAYRNLDLLLAEPDRRRIYGAAQDLPNYWRFVGVARQPGRCEQSGLAVSLVDSSGVVLCKSWTTANVHWAFDAPQHRDAAASPFAFDFTCPVENGEYFLVSQDAAGKVLEALPVVDRPPLPLAPPMPTANERTCGAYRNLELLATVKAKVDRRFVGVARNPASCDDSGLRVALVERSGTVACRARTAPVVSWPAPAEHAHIMSSGFAFDFTCPVGNGDYFLVTQDGAGNVLEALKVLP